MKYLIIITILVSIASISDANKGETIFKTTCSTCHKIGGGILIGPDLKDVTKRRDKLWLTKWIKSSQTLVESGDETAIAIFNEFNKVIMPDHVLTDDEIDSLLAYIEKQSLQTQKPNKIMTTQGTGTTDGNMFNALHLIFIIVTILFFIVILVQSNVIRTLVKELRSMQNSGE